MRGPIDWFFRDRTTGAIVVGQWPNLPLWLFGGFALAHWLAEATGANLPPHTAMALDVAARASLAWWALDELVRGVNPWRRCLGGAVLLLGSLSLAVRLWQPTV